MVNPIIEMLNSINNPRQNNDLNSMINAVKNSQNPNQILTAMASTNTDLASVLAMLNQNGKTPKETFYKMCELKGVDPNNIINQLR